MFHLLALLAASPWEWAASHLQLIGWPAIVLIAWKVGRAFTEVQNHFNTAVGQIDKMATNHFPHMEQSLAKQDIYLENIDKNIARLADKQ